MVILISQAYFVPNPAWCLLVTNSKLFVKLERPKALMRLLRAVADDSTIFVVCTFGIWLGVGKSSEQAKLSAVI